MVYIGLWCWYISLPTKLGQIFVGGFYGANLPAVEHHPFEPDGPMISWRPGPWSERRLLQRDGKRQKKPLEIQSWEKKTPLKTSEIWPDFIWLHSFLGLQILESIPWWCLLCRDTSQSDTRFPCDSGRAWLQRRQFLFLQGPSPMNCQVAHWC